MILLKKVEHLELFLLLQEDNSQQFLHLQYKRMFPIPQFKLTQALLLQLQWLIRQVNQRLNRVTLLLLVVLLVVAGLRDQVVANRQVAVDMEEDTK